MAKKIFEKLLEKLDKMSTRKLVTIAIATGIATLTSFVLAIITHQIISIVFFVIFICPFGLCTAQIITNKQMEDAKALFNEIKLVLSNEEFTQVLFKPENDYYNNIQRCLQIFDDFNVTHYAKIGNDNSVIVISKDANGNPSTPVTMDAAGFNRDYKVLK